MKCTKCGMELREKDAFCPNCGQPVPKTNNTGNNNEVGTQNTYTYENDNLKTIGHNGFNYSFI